MSGLDEWEDMQLKTFTRWCNEQLKDRSLFIRDMGTDFKSGVMLCHLLEIISGKALSRFNKAPKLAMQEQENCEQALSFLKSEGIKLVNIGGSDIHDGNLRLIMGLIWTLILRYEINKGDSNDANGKNKLLEWIRSKIPEYNIKNFTSDWNDGKAINALGNALKPGLCPNHRNLNPNDALSNATQGISKAETELGVAPLIYPAEMIHPKVSEHAVMCYLAQFMDAKPLSTADCCSAWGDGLENGVAGRHGQFNVQCPSDCKDRPKVWVDGPVPVDPSQVKLKDLGNGLYEVSYCPTEPGTYHVHVSVGGNEIPGSAFTVVVVPAHLRVFFGSSNNPNRSLALQEIEASLEAQNLKGLSNWVPLDCQEKKERDQLMSSNRGKVRAILLVIDDDSTLNSLQQNGQPDGLIDLARSLGGRPLKSTGLVPSTPAAAAPAASLKPSGSGIPKFCNSCGNKTGTSKFCTKCGVKLGF